MKRTAAQAFAPSPAVPPAPAAFQPTGAAMFDPKAYFQQFQQAAAVAAAAPSTSSSSGAPAAKAPSNDLLEQVKELSAVRCASLVKEKGDNFPTAVQIEALHTMATKSSYKLREELAKHPHVRKLGQRVLAILQKPPQGFALAALAKASWSLTRFPEELRGSDAQAMLGPTAKLLGSLPTTDWDVESASRVVWCLARNDAIYPHKQLVSQVVKELIRDEGVRIKYLSPDGLVNILFAIARARQHNHKGDHRTVQLEENDITLFDLIAKRVTAEIDTVSVHLLADLVHTHAEVGLSRVAFFKTMCPRILKDQKELREDVMAKVIKAYTRFMVPLREEAQGFRTMAVVAKGDFMRPSDKPKRTVKKTFDKPQALFEKTQVHARA